MKNIITYILFFVTGLILFSEIIFKDNTIFFDDIWRLSFPIRHFEKNNLEENGYFVKWCPYILNGIPVTGEGQSAGIYYPFNYLVYKFFPADDNVNINLILHFFMSLLFMFLLAKKLEFSYSGSIISSLIFALSGPFIAHHFNVAMTSAYPYLPLIFLFILKWQGKKKFIHLFICGLILGIQLLTGHPQLSYYSTLFIFIFLIILNIFNRDRIVKNITHILMALIFITVIAGIISFIQLYPTYFFMKVSGGRTLTNPGDFIQYISFNIKNIILFILPDIYGTTSSNSYFGPAYYWEYAGYSSVLAVITFFILFLKKNKSVFEKSLIITLLIFLVTAVILSTPLYKILILIPGISMFRAHSRLLYIISFLLALIAGKSLSDMLKLSGSQKLFLKICMISGLIIIVSGITVFLTSARVINGFNNYVNHPDNPEYHFLKKVITRKNIDRTGPDYYTAKFKRYILQIRTHLIKQGSLIILYSLSVLLFFSGKNKTVYFIIFILLIDLISFAEPLIPVINKNFFSEPPETLKFLRQKYPGSLKKYKIWSWNRGGMFKKIKEKTGYKDVSGHYYAKNFLPLNYSAFFNVSNFEGDMSLPYRDVIKFRNYIRETGNFKLLNYFSVRFVLTAVPVNSSYLKLIYSKEDVYIYENNQALPVFYMVYNSNIVFADSYDKTLDILKANAEKPDSVLIINNNNFNRLNNNDKNKGSVKVLYYKNDDFQLETETSSDCYLVNINSYHPDWKCIIDGQPSEIYKVNLDNMAVFVPAGKHKLNFKFD